MKNNAQDKLAKIHIAHSGGYLQCTSYLVEGPDGAVIVDPGSGSLETELITNINAIGYNLGQIRGILLTHCHVDHSLGAYRLQRTEIPVVASPVTADIMRAGGYQVWYEFPEYVIPTTIAKTFLDQEVFELAGLQIRALHTPGHTPGCATYLFNTAQGVTALTGDLIGGNGHPTWAGSEGFSVQDSLVSIHKILDYRPVRAYRGHGRGQFAQPAVDWLELAIDIGNSGKWRLDTERHPNARPPDCLKKASQYN